MAFTDDEKAQIRRYMGYSDINRQLFRNLEGTMDSVSTEGEAHGRVLLTKLASIETSLEALWVCAKVTAADDVRLDPMVGLNVLRKEGRRLATDLADIFDISPLRTPFDERRTSTRF